MSRNKQYPPVLDEYIDSGWIEEVVSVVKSGKEATVYCCRACLGTGREYIAAKVYRSRQNRSFKNDALYQEGRVIGNARDRRAVAKKTRYGREVQGAGWTYHEYSVLQELHAAGAIVPYPLTCESDALLLEYIGEGQVPGRPLYMVDLEPAEARGHFLLLVDQIALWLSLNHIHGDLSPFNILHTSGRITVIDFPQSVDPRFSPHALELLERDLRNVTDYFAPYGIRFNPARHAKHLWHEWQLGRV